MSRYQFKLAEASDDKALCHRMSEDSMQGAISVSFRRQPSYFTGTAVQGETCQVIKCVEKNSQKLVGLGARMTLHVFINGEPQRMGYLSDLRAAKNIRGGTLLMRGYGYLKELHQSDPVPLYYSVILDGNQAAIDNITSSRAGLPAYKYMGKICTPAIHLDFKRKLFELSDVEINTANSDSMANIFEFVQKSYAKKQFSPVYKLDDMNSPRLEGLNPEDIYIATRNGEIVGVIAAWDQTNFRQTHIENYNLLLKTIKPFYNLAAKFSALKPLPKKGDRVPYFYLALTAIKDDDPDIFRALLSRLYADRRNGKWHYFIAGLHEKNPLVKVLEEYRSIKAAGHLFVVHYSEDEAYFTQLDSRIPHVEIGAV